MTREERIRRQRLDINGNEQHLYSFFSFSESEGVDVVQMAARTIRCATCSAREDDTEELPVDLKRKLHHEGVRASS